MKKILFLFAFMLLAFSGYEATAQPTGPKNFKLEFGNVTYVRTYEMADKSQAEIADAITKYLPHVPGLGDIKYNGKVFYGQISNMMVDYPKYGGKWLTILPMLNVPFRSNITIEPKNGSYEMVLTNIEFRTDGRVPYENVSKRFTEKDGTVYSSEPRVMQAMHYMDQFLGDIFLASNNFKNVGRR